MNENAGLLLRLADLSRTKTGFPGVSGTLGCPQSAVAREWHAKWLNLGVLFLFCDAQCSRRSKPRTTPGTPWACYGAFWFAFGAVVGPGWLV